MVYHKLSPAFPLSDYVDSIYYLKMDMGNCQKKILPDFKTDLIFLYQTSLTGFADGKTVTVSSSIINGFRKAPLQFRYNGNTEMLGIRFLPFGFTQLFQIPPEEISQIFPASDIINQRIFRETEEKVINEPNPLKKLSIAEDWLNSLVSKVRIETSLAIKAIHRITKTNGVLPLQDICNQSPSEYKQLQRFCHRRMDIAPKTFSRMVRFEHLHQTLVTDPGNDWMTLVSNMGFTDQSHLIREIKEFTGLTPSAFKADINSYI